MLSLVFAAALFHDVFVSAGASAGTSFTDTRVRMEKTIGAQWYPSRGYLGVAYSFGWNASSLTVSKPFSAHQNRHIQVVGPALRFSRGKVQPWMHGGFSFYRERTKIDVFGEPLLRDTQKRHAAVLAAGSNMILGTEWYAEPSIRMLAVRRPTWGAAFRVGRRF